MQIRFIYFSCRIGTITEHLKRIEKGEPRISEKQEKGDIVLCYGTMSGKRPEVQDFESWNFSRSNFL